MEVSPPAIRRRIPNQINHGHSAYVNRQCKCEVCTAANRERKRVERAKNKKKGLPPGDPRHGTTNGYDNWVCRCEACTQAKRIVNRNNRETRNRQRRERTARRRLEKEA